MRFTLCASLYALHSMHFTLCTSLYALHSMHFTLCTSLHALHSMHFTLCTSLYALHSMHFTLCTSLYALHSMHFTLCTSLYALHSMHFTLCTSLYVVGSEGSARKNPSRCFREKTQKHYGFSTATTRKPAEGLRLYVKKRKNKTVLAPRPRENPQRGYVCMSRNAKTRRLWHRDHAKTRRGVTFVCQKTQKHDGFGTAPTPKPAEGCLRPRKKVPKTTVLAPRPGDYPQRVVRGQKETSKNDGFSTAITPKPAEGCPRTERNVKKRRFWHRHHAETRRGLQFRLAMSTQPAALERVILI